MRFSKLYHQGTFSDLVRMYSFDVHVKSEREKSWNETKQLESGVYVIVGESALLPLNK